jgi:hypothetical protein
MPCNALLFAAVMLCALVATVSGATSLVPCRFMVPFVIWTSATGCPTPGASHTCATDADCNGLPAGCTYGPGPTQMKCVSSLGASVCSHIAVSLPDLDRLGGFCNNTIETCSLSISASFPDVPRCVPPSDCAGSSVQCYADGHDVQL